MTTTIPWKSYVELSLECLGVTLGFLFTKIEGVEIAGYFLIGIHGLFIVMVLLGLMFYYADFYYAMEGEFKINFAFMYVFCMLATGVYFYFIVIISDPNVFDMILTEWGITIMFIIVLYIIRLIFFTYYAFEMYSSIKGRSIITKPEKPSQEVQEPKVPLYLWDYSKVVKKNQPF
eukprot:TRINITY_DN3446_c0_g1_i1.p2 TRINITY_DN3446_c0_g1~~TRINITY_DN3446_c0_g1_i1.p2  ORF type:complete len:175 (+),score=21.16 TRINITY_DN3446_c0_g1_i1:222-746(+)